MFIEDALSEEAVVQTGRYDINIETLIISVKHEPFFAVASDVGLISVQIIEILVQQVNEIKLRLLGTEDHLATFDLSVVVDKWKELTKFEEDPVGVLELLF